jgi:hypothetical protein
MLEHIGKISGMEGVAVAEHGGKENNGKARILPPPAVFCFSGKQEYSLNPPNRPPDFPPRAGQACLSHPA